MIMEVKKFKKVLVANRGEIAIRVFRALSELGIGSVAVYSKEDRYALFRTKADEAYPLNPDKGPVDAYLDIPTIIRIAKEKKADAIHPGYGFLSENAAFARRCQEEGIIFIGPNPETMEAMGDKISARIKMIEAGVPVVPGTQENLKSVEEAEMVAFCDLEIERAEKAKAAAENKLRENASQKEFERAEQKLRRAMNRLVVAGKK